jgi:hypothetical protein
MIRVTANCEVHHIRDRTTNDSYGSVAPTRTIEVGEKDP